MRQIALAATLFIAPVVSSADEANHIVGAVASTHILPRFEAFAESSASLADVAGQDCSPTSETVRSAFGEAFDDWIAASHLRFGPTEVEDRAFGIAFWPDSRGATPRTLLALIAEADPVATTPESYRVVSIAARGLFALEYLLYDSELSMAGDEAYRCTLVQTISSDIALTAQAILSDWQESYKDVMLNTGPEATYRSEQEALQELLKSLTTGLQFTSETRLGRPLGTFDRPRPLRAEARRSGRSSKHVSLSLSALRDLSAYLAEGDPDLAHKIDRQFENTQSQIEALDDPIFEGVSNPQDRLKIEIAQQSIEAIRTTFQAELGPKLGVAAGFNALDGD